jgi:hypothetical protein
MTSNTDNIFQIYERIINNIKKQREYYNECGSNININNKIFDINGNLIFPEDIDDNTKSKIQNFKKKLDEFNAFKEFISLHKIILEDCKKIIAYDYQRNILDSAIQKLIIQFREQIRKELITQNSFTDSEKKFLEQLDRLKRDVEPYINEKKIYSLEDFFKLSYNLENNDKIIGSVQTEHSLKESIARLNESIRQLLKEIEKTEYKL